MCNLNRFIDAQKYTYNRALKEISEGQKRDHWIWFIYPQLRGLGMSYMSDFYGIENIEEAQKYLENPILGLRLREITETLLKQEKTVDEIFGYPDNMKVLSCMTLFNEVSPNDIFASVIEKFYDGPDQLTLDMLENGPTMK